MATRAIVTGYSNFQINAQDQITLDVNLFYKDPETSLDQGATVQAVFAATDEHETINSKVTDAIVAGAPAGVSIERSACIFPQIVKGF